MSIFPQTKSAWGRLKKAWRELRTAKRESYHETTLGNMTPDQKKHFDEAFWHMDKAFEAMDRVFK